MILNRRMAWFKFKFWFQLWWLIRIDGKRRSRIQENLSLFLNHFMGMQDDFLGVVKRPSGSC